MKVRQLLVRMTCALVLFSTGLPILWLMRGLPQSHMVIAGGNIGNLTDSSNETLNDPSPSRTILTSTVSVSLTGNVSPKVVVLAGVGRLGNKMFQYAALMGLAHRHGFTPYVFQNENLAKTFELSHISQTQYTNLPVYFEKAAASYDPCVETMRRDLSWRLGGYYQSWRYFADVVDIVRKEFTFKENIRTPVRDYFAQLEAKGKGRPKVGVHIRRGDMGVPVSAKRGYTVAPATYFKKAMAYFRSKLKDPLFIVCSDDINWGRTQFGKEKDVEFLHKNENVDLATLSSCNHSIISTGTYGWWGAWLAGGETIYYKNFPKNGTWLATQYVASDYFPPSWIGME
ncbi:galactoside alpha-(1,2)-fucosyltransferase 1-like [Haliotis rufescens]|uniref:galactoside alpha-(1,2)-fucosyltransferase 1-like n=1 Tax=Haliotis rufescens TaxID=6454 RepID=UPI00201EB66F|nr:galactoside alpha-(1,2)-fucosyltransferase 1-like [Haliotis rufescens]XP_046381695.2 galactoside alpha-(1,2)-fucosyltransferase 1-like [Haliotis rufescens]